MPKCFRRPCNLFSMAARRQALRNDPQLQRYVIPNVQPTGRQLGVGSYGSVEELEIISLICAGKRIHESLIEAGNVGVQRIVRKYVEECQLMSDLRHPHVVQFMGVCFLPDSSLPVLVMERLLMSLDNLLENTPDIPLAVKRSMLADVSKGLVYLHNRSSPIIHRDLSAKNILLNSGMVAKISDLGNSRIVDFQPGQLMKTLSRIPGTPVYMPPEALYSLPGYEADKSQYGTKIDIFSFGHLSLFTITQDFPHDLLPPTYPDPNSRGRLVALTEVERRGKYIDQLHQQLGERHPIVQLVKECLDNDPEYRPSSEDVLQRLEGMKSQIQDPYQDLTKVEMMKLLEQKDRENQSQLQQVQGTQAMEALRSQLQQVQLEKSGSERALQAELEVKGDQLSRLQGETDTMRRDLRALQSDISTKDSLLQVKDGQLQRKSRQLQEKDCQLNEKDSQLQEKDIQLHEKDSQLQGKDIQLQKKDSQLQGKDRQLQDKDTSISALQSDISAKDMLLASVRADLEARETRMREEIQQRDAEIDRLIEELGTFQSQLQVEPILQPGTLLQWKKCADLPVGMRDAQAIMLKNKVYFGGGFTESRATATKFYIYSPMVDKWATLPSPTRYSALATYNSQLVLVGGMASSTVTNQFWVLQDDERTWRQPLPDMPTARYAASAINHHNYLIVAGGKDSNRTETDVVEVYDGHQWMRTDSLPKCCSSMRTTFHNGNYYLMGGSNQGHSVFCASLQSLIAKTTQQSLTSLSSDGRKSAWETLLDVPYHYSATTILGAALVAVGGYGSSGTHMSSLHMYSPLTNVSWLHVGEMPVAVCATCTITLPTGELMVIGGWTEDTQHSRLVYIADLHPT